MTRHFILMMNIPTITQNIRMCQYPRMSLSKNMFCIGITNSDSNLLEIVKQTEFKRLDPP